MSRCYPYPPPGYGKNGGPMTDWIKLQRERDEVGTDIKKRKKSEKKEKNKVQKGKEKLTGIGDGKIRKVNYEKCDQLEQRRADCVGYFQKRIEEEAEQLEKSDLTEEHEQPILSPNASSQSSEGSNKRKRHTSPTSSFRSQGTIIRIRLPLKKDRDTSVRNEQLCSTSGRVDFHCQQKNESVNVLEHCRTTSAKECILVEDVTPSPKEELPFIVPGEIEATANKNEIGRTESLFNALIEDWVPPAPQYQGDDFDNEEWLFKTKQEDRRGSNRYKAGNEVTCSRSRSLWPHAHYMPDADIYALPYTIPF